VKLGIFGGTFNPVHTGHLIIAEFIRTKLNLEKVLFIPAALPPHKAHLKIISPEYRFQMLKLATHGNPDFDVSRIELERDGFSYTINTIEQIRATWQLTQNELFLLIGADSLVDLRNWYNPFEIYKLCQVVVFPRPLVDLEKAKPFFLNNSIVLEAPILDISSSFIRQRLSCGESIRYLVPEAVLNFIQNHKLYG